MGGGTRPQYLIVWAGGGGVKNLPILGALLSPRFILNILNIHNWGEFLVLPLTTNEK